MCGPGSWPGLRVPYYACAPRWELGLRAMLAGALRRTALRVVRWTDRLEYPGLSGAEIRRERAYLRERRKVESWGATLDPGELGEIMDSAECWHAERMLTGER